MAYRKPIHPKVDRWEHRQSWAARATGFGLLAVLAGLAWANADRIVRVAPAARPLALAVGAPVSSAIAPPPGLSPINAPPDLACRASLRQSGVAFQDIPDSTSGDYCLIHDALVLTSGTVALHPADAVMVCRQALAFATWDRQAVQPLAQRLLGARVVSIEQFGAYECRRRYGRADQPVSEHALADALDVGVFVLADGRRVSVADDWSDPGPKGAFLHAVRDQACGIFSTVLSPDYNPEHHNHLHLDMEPLRPGRGRFCH